MNMHLSPSQRAAPYHAPSALTVVCHRDDRAAVQFVIELVAVTTGVSSDQIRTFSRNHARVARARQIAMYLTNISWQWPLVRVGKAFGRDRTTVGHACRLIEDLRDDPQFDAMLERLEASLETVPKKAGTAQAGPDWFERTF
ncbi:MAG: helix-turn-helix domain-containing protein [Asticcacaulis sp.]